MHYSLGFQTLGSCWAHKRASFELSWRKVYQRWWGGKLKSKGWCIFFAKVNLGASLSRFSHSCIGEKKGINGCLDRWYNLLLWMMKTWITLWKKGWAEIQPHLPSFNLWWKMLAFLKKVLMIAWKMGRNFLAFRISNFIDTKLKFEMVWYGLDLWYKSYWNIQQLWFIINLVKSKLKLSGRFWWDLGSC